MEYPWEELGPLVVGVDEVGRGCLAGPVFAAAVILPRPYDQWKSLGIRDSKKLDAKKRKLLCEKLVSDALCYWSLASTEEIDCINILRASLLAMRRAVEGLFARYDEVLNDIVLEDKAVNDLTGPRLTDRRSTAFKNSTVLVDGRFSIPGLDARVKQIPLVKGDDLALPVAAASIVAKVKRDQELTHLGRLFPGYGFEKHKGYCTSSHLKAIRELGPCEIHRKSFSGVKEHV